MKYTRSAAQRSQQQTNNNNNNNNTNLNTSTTRSKNKSSNKTKKLNKKSTSKKQSSKYYSESDDDNDYYDYDYDEEIDVGAEYYDEDDYENYINSNKNKKVNNNKNSKSTRVIIDNDDNNDSLDDIDDLDEITQDSNVKSQLSDNDYYYNYDDDLNGDLLPELKLPQSSDDLLINKENLLDCLSVYETIRHFRNILRLTPFLFEDFCACLATNENNSLFSEIHISLIKILLKEDELNLVSYGPSDLKTCIDVSLHLIDAFTWPEILRQYIESDFKMINTNSELLKILSKTAYPLVNINEKLIVLNSLCNMFLSTSAVRNDLLSEGNIISDDHCRICHKLGNLLCCETCPATYHLDCLDPPLTNVPEDDWICSICKLHQLRGVTDCVSDVEKTGLLIRQEPLGYDRHRRKYWFLCRRIVVESENEIYYYSTKLQFDELIKSFDPTKYESKLIKNINEQYEEIVRCMQITEDLTNLRKESKKSYFDEDNERIRKMNEVKNVKKETSSDDEDKEMNVDRLSPIGKDEILKFDNEKIKIDNSDSEKSNLNEKNEEEYFQTPKQTDFKLNENDQLDGIVDNLIENSSLSTTTTTKTTTSPQSIIRTLKQTETDSNIIRVDLSKDDIDDEEHELLPSRFNRIITNSHVVNGFNTSPQKPLTTTTTTNNDEQILAKSGIKRNNLLVPIIKITDLNNLIPDLPHQKVKIVNDKGLNLSSDASKTITVLNKDSTRYKLAILPNNNETTTSTTLNNSNNFLNFKVNTQQIKIINNNNIINKVNTTNIKQIITNNNNMQQDFEFGDAFKFIKNIKPTIASIDNENISTTTTTTVSNVVPSIANSAINFKKSDKLISSIFENLAKSNQIDSTNNKNNTNNNNNDHNNNNHNHVPPPLYKLGMESNYRLYENQYSVNPITMNKHQHNQERDRKNILSRRFMITQDFNWKGGVFSNFDILARNIASTIISIENLIPIPFMHHLWPKYRDKWLRKLYNSKNIIDFAKCLLELEASMKPILFVGAWKDGTGYLKLHRETQQEREEHKKEESHFNKRKTILNTTIIHLDDTVYQPQIQAHFTKGLKHQVFKQKGEEYRLAGTGGWYWIHKTRRSRSKIDKNQNNYLKMNNQSSEVKQKLKNLLLDNLKDKKCIENLLVEEDSIPEADQPWYNNSLHPYLQVFNIETIDISENLLTRQFYLKELKQKPKFLDQLLEKRLKIYEETKISNELSMKKLEEKLIDIEIEELKKSEVKKKVETDAAVASLETTAENGSSNDEINKKIDEEQESIQISREAIREKIDLNDKIRNILKNSNILLSGEYLVEINNELIRIPIIENNTSYKFKLKNLNFNKKKRVSHDAKLPPYTNYMINNKTTIFAFPYEITRLIARKGGFRIEIPGFKSDHHKQTVYWPYPCNRPLLKTCWSYKTFTATNLSSLALQIRYFYSCIRWDAINEKPPVNSSSYHGGIEPILTEHFDDYMLTTELVKKRNFGLYNLRSEYLLRRKKTPYKKTNKSSKQNLSNSLNNTPPPISRSTPRRSGLRQLKQSVGQFNESLYFDNDSNSGFGDGLDENPESKKPIEEWVIEDRLHLWQIKSFYDRSKRFEIEEIRKKEKLIKQQQLQQQQQQQQQASVITYNPSKIIPINKSTPQQTVSQHLSLNAPLNLLNNQYKINQSPTIINNTNSPSSASTITTATTTIINQMNKPILNMTKVIPRTSNQITTAATVLTTGSTTPLQLTNLKVLNTTNSPSNINKTLKLASGHTITILAKPQPTTPTQINITSPQIAVTAQKSLILASPNTIKSINTTNSLSNLKLNSSPTVIIQQKAVQNNVIVTGQQHQTKSTEISNTSSQDVPPLLPPTLISLPPTTITTPNTKTATATPNATTTTITTPIIPTTSLLSKTINNNTPNKTLDLLNKTEQIESLSESFNTDSNSRVKRQRKLPAKLNDSYDLTYESGLNSKSRTRPKSIQSILAQKEANETNNNISAKTTNILNVSSQVEPIVKSVVSEQELITKSEQLLEEIENRAKRKRQDMLQKQVEDLKEMIKYKKAVMVSDVMESVRLDIDLETYFEMKNNLTQDEFLNKINLIQLEKSNKEKEEILAKEKQKKLEEDNQLTIKKENEKKIEQQQLEQQKQQLNEIKNNENVYNKKDEIVNNNDNYQTENDKIINKRKSKLRPETLSPSSLNSKENVEQEQELKEQQQQQSHVVLHDDKNKKTNKNEKYEFIPKLKIPKHQLTASNKNSTTESHVTQYVSQTELNTRKRKISFNNDTVLNTSESSNSINMIKVLKRNKNETSIIETQNNKNKNNNKTYCICNSVYDKRRFYIQCDQCSNWYHGECVGITPQMAAELDQYKCMKCKNENNEEIKLKSVSQYQHEQHDTNKKRGRKKSIFKNEEQTRGDLFCLCKKPYDERLFYIGCDKCQDWCHGSCVGILPIEAYTLDTYTCPKCLKNERKEWSLESKISNKNLEFIKNTFYAIKNNRMAWPFLTAVDANEVPNYYQIIKEPMDLSIIESRLNNGKYTKYIEFIYDVSKIIENCRLFNPIESKFYKCANAIEKIFSEKLKLLKQMI